MFWQWLTVLIIHMFTNPLIKLTTISHKIDTVD